MSLDVSDNYCYDIFVKSFWGDYTFDEAKIRV